MARPDPTPLAEPAATAARPLRAELEDRGRGEAAPTPYSGMGPHLPKSDAGLTGRIPRKQTAFTRPSGWGAVKYDGGQQMDENETLKDRSSPDRQDDPGTATRAAMRRTDRRGNDEGASRPYHQLRGIWLHWLGRPIR